MPATNTKEVYERTKVNLVSLTLVYNHCQWWQRYELFIAKAI